MATPVNEVEASYHILLIGVDAYQSRPLHGCVNDIDAVQRMLLGPRMRIPPQRIRRLASPHARDRRATEIHDEPATLDNLRAALADLGSGRIAPDDRVFIYYAGHGTRVEVTGPDGRRFHREALVPVDCDEQASDPRLLYDFELNRLLGAIVERTRSVAVVLDCCHASGATRDALDPGDWQPRFLEVTRGGWRSGPLPDPGSTAERRPERLAASVEDCQVVSACMAHERAQEGRHPGGVRQGLFTHAFISALDDAADPDLRTVTWGRIWQAMCDSVQQRNPGQHVSMIGHAQRAVFAGPPTEGDAGIPVSQKDGVYRLAVGTLAGVTDGARLAVYGAKPVHFPRLDSEEDRKERAGVLRVTRARRAEAEAEAEGPPFELPPGARARLVAPGATERLRCAVIPPNRELEQQLATAPLLELVEDPVQADVRLEQRADRWFVTDTMHGTGSADDAPVLFALQRAELDCARDVLEHYYLYSRPLQVATRATELRGSLVLRVLSCPDHPLAAAEAQGVVLPEAPSSAEYSYGVTASSRVCFQAANRSRYRLRVTLLNSAGSGKVQLLGDEILEPGAIHVFWAGGTLGMPFQMTPPRGSDRCIDRLVAIGRTSVGHDLSYLRVDRSFADIIQRSRSSGRVFGDSGRQKVVLERWTAAQVVIETRRT